MKDYRVFSNWDLSGLGTILTPQGGVVGEPINKEHVKTLIQDAANTSVDAILCCPTVLRCPLWDSKVRPYWHLPISDMEEPEYLKCTSSQRTMNRLRKYVKAGGDPLRETYEATRECGMDFFFSLRMNDWHNMNELRDDNHDAFPTLDLFYKQHPEYRIGELNEHNPVGWTQMNPYMEDYMHKEVHEHYLALIDELLDYAPIDGLELDFMRCGNYFKESQLEQGIPVMTDFIMQVRKKLDREGEKQGKFLPLVLRMPQKYEYCRMIGFDLETLAKKKAFQIVNVTSSYLESINLDIEEFKEKLPGIKVFGEIQAMTSSVRPPLGKGWSNERRLTEEMFFAAANSIWQRGGDGVTLFNYQFLRRLTLAGWKEPQFPDITKRVLEKLADKEYLKTCGKHYIVSGAKDVGWEDVLPATGKFTVTMRVFEDLQDYASAKLRLVSKDEAFASKKTAVSLNGISLKPIQSGELYRPYVDEGLPIEGQAVTFEVDVNALCPDNKFVIESTGEVFIVELALYPKNAE